MDGDTQWLTDLRPGDQLISVWRGACQVVTVDRLTRTQVVVHRGAQWERYYRVGARIAQKVGDADSTIRRPAGNEVAFIGLSSELAQCLGLIGIMAQRLKTGQGGVSIGHLSVADLREAVAQARGLLDKIGRP